MRRNQRLWMTMLTLALVGCIGNSSENREIIATIEHNRAAAQNEDVKTFMDTLDPESPLYAASRQIMHNLVQQYDLNYEILTVKVVKKTNTEAKVRVTMVTKKVSGPEFRDNRMIAVNDLVKRNGKWKISSTTIEQITYLN